MIMPPFSCCKARDHHVARAGQTDREGIVAPGPRAHNPVHRRLCGLPVRENPWQQAFETEAGEEKRIWGRNRKVAGHSCPRIPMHAGREERRGGTVGRVWSSRGAQQGVARCTHAGPWLDILHAALDETFLCVCRATGNTETFDSSPMTRTALKD